MTTAEIVAMAAALLTSAGIGGIIAAWINTKIASRKVPSEIKKTEAETADILVEAAGAAVKLVTQELEKKISNVTTENTALRCELSELRSENAALRDVQNRHEKEIGELQAIAEKFEEVLGGAHILYDQVVELQGTPKYKPPERRKKA